MGKLFFLQHNTYYTFQNCNMCINTGISNTLIRPLMLISLSMIRLLQSSRLGFSARYARQCARNIFCSCVTSSSGGYLTISLDKSGFPSGWKNRRNSWKTRRNKSIYVPPPTRIQSGQLLTSMTVSSKNSAEMFLNTMLSSFTSLEGVCAV